MLTEEALEAAQTVAAAEKVAHNHSAIWGYDKPVMAALAPFLPEDRVERRALLVAIQDMARAKDPTPFGGEWTGYTIVANLLDSPIAWLTPGFAEARRAKLYGN